MTLSHTSKSYTCTYILHLYILYIIHCKQQKLSENNFCSFHRFLMNRKSFTDECSVEQWLSLALDKQLNFELKTGKIHLDEIQ